jgi:hypothetical protein
MIAEGEPAIRQPVSGGKVLGACFRLGIDVAERRSDVALESRACLGFSSPEGEVREPVVLGEKHLGIGGSRHHQTAVAIRLVIEIGLGGEHARRAAGRDQRRVDRIGALTNRVVRQSAT